MFDGIFDEEFKARISGNLTQARLKELLTYDPLTGVFVWKVAIGRKICAGDIAGTKVRPSPTNKTEYIAIGVDRKRYYAHRLAFLYMVGEFPSGDADHKDKNGLNNKWSNLREATTVQNHANSIRKAGKSEILGVQQSGQNWMARISINGKCKSLGSFATKSAAELAFLSARIELHGGFNPPELIARYQQVRVIEGLEL